MKKIWNFFGYLFAQILIIFSNDSFYKYKYLNLYKNESGVLLSHIKKVAMQFAENEKLSIINVNFDKINKDEVYEAHKAVGRFVYLTGENILRYNKIIEGLKRNNEVIDDDLKYPRVELTEKSDVFVLLHELGHYVIYKNNEVQSEFKADEYIGEFFSQYLPDFFSWIFQIEISVRSKKELKYSDYDSYIYYKKYKKWLKENNY